MNEFFNILLYVNHEINRLVWGPHMLILLLGTGLCLSIQTHFFQVRKFPHALSKTLLSVFKDRKNSSINTITPFQALTTALASTIGTGNIVGVAAAIAVGGPGSVFWIWISAFLGMMTKYSEILLSIKYRIKNDEGKYVGGPMYYISNGLKKKWLGTIFAIFGLLASFGIGNITQINSIAYAMYNSLNINPLITGIIIAVVISFIIVGGVNRIAKTTEKLVPYMVLFYMTITFIVLAVNIKRIPDSFRLIITYAFSDTAAIGGFAGSTVMLTLKIGIARGIFANEAGLGSSPIAHAAADTKNPVNQALWGITEVFINTIVVCTCTALVIISTDVWSCGQLGVNLTIAAFSKVFPTFAPFAITISVFAFAFSTLVSWSYYGEKCLEYLVGTTHFNVVYKLIYSGVIVIGATSDISLVWHLSDTLNGLMAVPNLIGLLGLSGVVINETKRFYK